MIASVGSLMTDRPVLEADVTRAVQDRSAHDHSSLPCQSVTAEPALIHPNHPGVTYATSSSLAQPDPDEPGPDKTPLPGDRDGQGGSRWMVTMELENISP
jgi:hypothetical protein